QFTGADIHTNAATIVLDGPASQIVNWQSGANALANFAANAAEGAFTIQSGRSVTTAGAFSNAGNVTVGAGSTFTAAGGYTQTDGRTTLGGGALVAALVDVQGGVLDGSGSIAGDVRNAGRLSVGGTGAAGSLDIHGSYEQTVAGLLDIEIGGLTPGAEHDYLHVDGTAALDGALNIALINDFVPDAGDLFTFLSFNRVAGDFAAI